MPITRLERHASGMVNSDTCPRPTIDGGARGAEGVEGPAARHAAGRAAPRASLSLSADIYLSVLNNTCDRM
jgi:hypothetical protein